MKYLFGPVPSRRLGFSLGVDIIPYKTCSFDCIYCELGKTTCKTVAPVDSVKPEAVLSELRELLASPATVIDFITLSGSGEPTLHPDLGLIIREIKKMANLPVALITNASLLYREEVLERVLEADVIVPSLDATDSEVFETVNRPHPSLSYDQLIAGLTRLGRLRRQGIWLEVLLLKGINDSAEQIEQLHRTIEQINPEKVQINTVVRPPVEPWALPVEYARLREVQKSLGAGAEIISGSGGEKTQAEGAMIESEIRAMVTRRPCTAEDIAQCLGVPLEETNRVLDGLLKEEKIRCEEFNRRRFYRGL
jgi:wyosine [tRNA(Phe)-imidazoG37] synthetase (radical SAM superfamily)